jgi:hypothetical protein
VKEFDMDQINGDSEIWKPVARDPRYRISNQGRLTGTRGQMLSPCLGPIGYYQVHIGPAWVYVHHLVAEAFIGPRPDGMEIRHLNGKRYDSRADNLAYGTVRENRLDQQRHGTDWELNKTHCSKGHEYSLENTYRAPAKPNKRECRKCRAVNQRNRKDRRRAAQAADM